MDNNIGRGYVVEGEFVSRVNFVSFWDVVVSVGEK